MITHLPTIKLMDFRRKYKLDTSTLLIPYGSRVYNTFSSKSDYDYMAIVPDDAKIKTGEEYNDGMNNIHVYCQSDWQEQLNNHKVHCLEGWFHHDGQVQKHFKWVLDLSKLRHEWSAKSSNSWVKAKKKIDVEKDYLIGWKSLFHSLRILNFGIQIAKDNKIDFSSANHFWEEIKKDQRYEWKFYKEKYQPIYNSLASEFKKAAPK